MKRRGFHIVVALAACLLASTHVFAQGGGASTTGSINGKVADSSGGVLPGVTVTAASSSLMGVQTSVTDTGGKIVGRRIDLYVANAAQARQFGKKLVRVQLLQTGRGRQDARDKEIRAATVRRSHVRRLTSYKRVSRISPSPK